MCRREDVERKERERKDSKFPSKSYILSPSPFFLFFTLSIFFLFFLASKILDGSDHLRCPRLVQGHPSSRFTGFTYLMFLPQIVRRQYIVRIYIYIIICDIYTYNIYDMKNKILACHLKCIIFVGVSHENEYLNFISSLSQGL